MDTVHFKVKNKHKIVTKIAYVCTIVDMKGRFIIALYKKDYIVLINRALNMNRPSSF